MIMPSVLQRPNQKEHYQPVAKVVPHEAPLSEFGEPLEMATKSWDGK